MSSRSVGPFEYPTALLQEKQGGCLSGFLLPPLAVMVIGLVLAFIWFGASPAASTQAAEPAITSIGAPAIQPPSGPISPVFQPEVQYWDSSIRDWAASAGLDPNLVATVMQIESCGDPQAYSSAGAIGLFQVMPYHFAAGDAPYDPNTNALRGLAYLARSWQAANGNPRLALAGYNGGIGVIGRSEISWAAETQRYAYWGSGIYAEASNGADKSTRLDEWLAAGGASLCRQASSRLGLSQ